MSDPVTAQGVQRMFPGSVGGQSRIATPVTLRPGRREEPRRKKICPIDLGFADGHDFPALNPAQQEVWFPVYPAAMSVRSYPDLTETDFFYFPTYSGFQTYPSGPLVSDNGGTMYIFATTAGSTDDLILYSIDYTHSFTVVNAGHFSAYDFLPVGLAWLPIGNTLFAFFQEISSGYGSLYTIPTSGGSWTSIWTPDPAAPLPGVSGSIFPPVTLGTRYVVCTYQHDATPRGLYVYDLAGGVESYDTSIYNNGFFPTTDILSPFELIAWDANAGQSRTWLVTSPFGFDPPEFTETSNPIRNCAPFNEVWFDDGFSAHGPGNSVFRTDDVWRYR